MSASRASGRKKLIEMALPLDSINAASRREKSIRHGHPSTLHLWWARRPLAAARIVIFAQMVDAAEDRASPGCRGLGCWTPEGWLDYCPVKSGHIPLRIAAPTRTASVGTGGRFPRCFRAEESGVVNG